jgi:hypothetical protein
MNRAFETSCLARRSWPVLGAARRWAAALLRAFVPLAALASCSPDPGVDTGPEIGARPAGADAGQGGSALVWAYRGRLTAPYTKGDFFGASLAVSGDTLVVGAPAHDGENKGKAYVFRRDGADWALQQLLSAQDGLKGDRFGYSVAVSEDTIVVGARHHTHSGTKPGSGAAYVFARGQDGHWFFQYEHHDPDADESAPLGGSVAVSGDLFAVGPYFPDKDKNPGAGSVYLFRRDGQGNFTTEPRLVGEKSAPGDGFGYSVAMLGSTLVVGNALSSPSAAYVYTRGDAGWSRTDRLSVAAAETFSIGASIALSGDRAVVGAPVLQGGNPGLALVFDRRSDAWLPGRTLAVADDASSFGRAVAVSGETILVGAGFRNNGDGAAHVFTSDGKDGFAQLELVPEAPATGAMLGYSVAISRDTLFVGAAGDGAQGELAGAVHVFVFRHADGQACTDASQCAVACVGGVCCDSACDGKDQACTAVEKGSGEDGVCGSTGERSYYSCEAAPSGSRASLVACAALLLAAGARRRSRGRGAPAGGRITGRGRPRRAGLPPSGTSCRRSSADRRSPRAGGGRRAEPSPARRSRCR